MANYMQLSFQITLIVVLISVIYVNSLPINGTIDNNITAEINATSLERKNTCYTSVDCNNHGICFENTTRKSCQCNKGWVTIGDASDFDNNCIYQQRSKKTAFFLSFFLGTFGVDWFYLSRAQLIYIFVGILKLLLGLSCEGVWFLTYFGPETQNLESIKSKFRGLSTCFSLLAFAWWIVDWARILGNRFPDGNGIRLYQW
ncbi:hypothetical protein I4U23_006423 [Adineta vaga]|nr:hypothetical protein I4U23_006423 [Adineta vaga]